MKTAGQLPGQASKKALLTIDDGPSELTRSIVDFLQRKKIAAVLFFIGGNMERHPEVVQYAIESGFVIGNHSYSHSAFSTLSVEQSALEISRTEDLITKAYAEAGAERKWKVFRFPFGDKGGAQKEAIQGILRQHGFQNAWPLDLQYAWYFEHQLDKDRDIFWTFDTLDYQIADPKYAFSFDDALEHLKVLDPASGGSLLQGLGDDIVLIHDHTWSNDVKDGYFPALIEGIEALGVRFIGKL